MFDLQVRRAQACMILDLSGALGREGGQMILHTVEAEPTLPERLLLNFRAVESMNTAGLGGVLWAVRLMHKGQKQSYAYGLTDHFRKVFHVMGLTQYIAVVENEAAALR